VTFGGVHTAEQAAYHAPVMPSPEMPLTDVAPDLPPTYYLDNFLTLLTEVSGLYDDLLSESELSFVEDFLALDADAQCLYVRLVSRKGDWFRRDKLKYPEISDLDHALATLVEERFVDVALPSDGTLYNQRHEWLNLFTKAELLKAVKSALKSTKESTEKGSEKGSGLTRFTALGKADLVAALACADDVSSEDQERNDVHTEEAHRVLAELPDEPLICVFGAQELETLRLLFFGNGFQDMTEFVLRDLGIYRYEDYPLDHSHRWCQTRPQLERHLAYYHQREAAGDLKVARHEALVDMADAVCDETLTTDAMLARRSQRFLNDIARQLERLGRCDEALAVYARSHRHPARERRVRLLVSAGRDQEAMVLAHSMMDDLWCEDERQFLLSFAPRKLSQDGSLIARLEAPAPAHEVRTLFLPAEQRLEHGVEHAARMALELETDGDEVVYCENLLIPGVFGLVFWEAIFAPVPGAFFHPFQVRPADLYEDEFTDVRSEAMDAGWAALGSLARLKATVLERFQEKFGRANPFVHWGFLNEELLTTALERLPLAHWRACFEFLLRDLRHHKAGLPDLIRFPKEGGYQLIEVKGPGDTLQKNQKVWLEAFARAGMPAQVLLVRDSD